MPDEAAYDPSPEDRGADAAPAPPGLVLVSTPIGNLGDMTPRGREALRSADLILCEDTRHTGRLLSAFGIRKKLQSLHDYNEETQIAPVLALLGAGKRVALVSDAGTPVVSDPGFRLVRAAIEAGVEVSAIPGANAAVTALILSGLPPLPFLFLGFPPARRAARRAAFARLRAAEHAGLQATLIWYEAPHRLAETLADMEEAFGERPAAVARELTKRFEEVRRGSLTEVAAHYGVAGARGEITVLLGPAGESVPEEQDLDAQLNAAMACNTLKDAAAFVATATGLPRKVVYARALALSAARK